MNTKIICFQQKTNIRISPVAQRYASIQLWQKKNTSCEVFFLYLNFISS